MIRHSSNDRAAKELSPTAYKMFVKFALNSNGYQFALSPKALEKELGIKETAYRNAVVQLIDLGYLIPIPDTYEEYVFMPNPPRAKALNTDIPPVECDTRPVKMEGGSQFIGLADFPESEGGEYQETEEPPCEMRSSPPLEHRGQIIQDNNINNNINNNIEGDISSDNNFPKYYNGKYYNHYNYDRVNQIFNDMSAEEDEMDEIDEMIDDVSNYVDMPVPKKQKYSYFGFSGYEGDMPF